MWLFGAAAISAPVFTFEKPGFECPIGIDENDCE
jgi:hypothetical protein